MSLPLVNDKREMVHGRGHVSHLSQSIRSEHAYPLTSPDDDNSHRGLLGQLTSYLHQHHRDTTLVVVREAGLVTVLPRSMNGQRLDITIEMEKINCQVITYNLEVVKVLSQEPGDMSVIGKLVTEFLVDERLCPGLEDLGEQELDPLLDRLGRADICQLLIEKFHGHNGRNSALELPCYRLKIVSTIALTLECNAVSYLLKFSADQIISQ